MDVSPAKWTLLFHSSQIFSPGMKTGMNPGMKRLSSSFPSLQGIHPAKPFFLPGDLKDLQDIKLLTHSFFH